MLFSSDGSHVYSDAQAWNSMHTSRGGWSEMKLGVMSRLVNEKWVRDKYHCIICFPSSKDDPMRFIIAIIRTVLWLCAGTRTVTQRAADTLMIITEAFSCRPTDRPSARFRRLSLLPPKLKICIYIEPVWMYGQKSIDILILVPVLFRWKNNSGKYPRSRQIRADRKLHKNKWPVSSDDRNVRITWISSWKKVLLLWLLLCSGTEGEESNVLQNQYRSGRLQTTQGI